MNLRLLLIAFAATCTVPLLAQQLQPPSTPEPLQNAVRSLVGRFANLPPALPKKSTAKKPVFQMPQKILVAREACSIPLTNVRPPTGTGDTRMPRIPPRDIDRMPNIVPAPPCTGWPPQ